LSRASPAVECLLWVEMLGKADLICVNVEDLEYATD
jgi:hypothetical protein